MEAPKEFEVIKNAVLAIGSIGGTVSEIVLPREEYEKLNTYRNHVALQPYSRYDKTPELLICGTRIKWR